MNNQQVIIGIMGPGENASKEDCALAFEVGKILASEKYSDKT